MRAVHWLFIVSAALFVSAIGLTVGAARMARHVPVVSEPVAATTTPVATIWQIMTVVVSPSANDIFDAVQTSVTAKGIEEIAPQTDREWQVLGGKAALVAESGNLLLDRSRAVDDRDWVKTSREMIEAATRVLQATREKNTTKVLEAGEALNASCDACHRKYQRGD